mgnify:CR=1 FL=1|tara:strand:- start:2122 stop:2334 length:213 start_codon:yes stop_codon:yes gene_type:complete
MYEQDIKEIIKYGYWPGVIIKDNKFVAQLYKLRKRPKEWRLVKTREFKTPAEAWSYLQETLSETLKFVIN